jgi:hypothetical protein
VQRLLSWFNTVCEPDNLLVINFCEQRAIRSYYAIVYHLCQDKMKDVQYQQEEKGRAINGKVT